ncbi:MAG: d(CMP) kinase, partial [Paracoccaceae bacterium]
TSSHFGFAHLDTGLLYRAVGFEVLAGAEPVSAARNLSVAALSGPDLRTDQVARAASQVAAMAPVRAELLVFQQSFARRDGGAVLDGRDIGTVVCPDADVKLFVTASDEVRARRRFDELRGAPDITLAQVRRDLRERDARDAGRDVAPMRRAPDAVLLDTSDLSISAAVQVAIDRVQEKLSPHRVV